MGFVILQKWAFLEGLQEPLPAAILDVFLGLLCVSVCVLHLVVWVRLRTCAGVEQWVPGCLYTAVTTEQIRRVVVVCTEGIMKQCGHRYPCQAPIRLAASAFFEALFGTFFGLAERFFHR